jgi:hypothetical protein
MRLGNRLMIASMLAAMSLFGFGRPAQVETQRVNLRPWTLLVSKDRFTGAVTCLAQGRHMSIQDDVVLFDLGPRQDTAAAVYKLDGGAARKTLASVPAGMLPRAVLDRTPLDNPSNGLVALPLASVSGVRRVDIRANARTQPVGFDLSGVPALLKAEAAHGCAGAGHGVAVVRMDAAPGAAKP